MRLSLVFFLPQEIIQHTRLDWTCEVHVYTFTNSWNVHLAALQHRLSSLTTLIRYQFLSMALSVSPIIMYWVCSRVEALYRYWSFGFYRYQLYFLSKSTNTNHRSVPDISAELTYQYTSILEEIHTVLQFVFT